MGSAQTKAIENQENMDSKNNIGNKDNQIESAPKKIDYINIYI